MSQLFHDGKPLSPPEYSPERLNPITCAPGVLEEESISSKSGTMPDVKLPANCAEGLVFFPRRLPEPCREPKLETTELTFTDETREFHRCDLERCQCGCFPKLVADFHHDEASGQLIYPVRRQYQVICGNERCANKTEWVGDAKSATRIWQLARKLEK